MWWETQWQCGPRDRIGPLYPRHAVVSPPWLFAEALSNHQAKPVMRESSAGRIMYRGQFLLPSIFYRNTGILNMYCFLCTLQALSKADAAKTSAKASSDLVSGGLDTVNDILVLLGKPWVKHLCFNSVKLFHTVCLSLVSCMKLKYFCLFPHSCDDFWSKPKCDFSESHIDSCFLDRQTNIP